ncbi:MarC family protein [Polycladidibacter hongkongensis]|uniref:MarC family protein n=1 Tax=Polycladidibacter hongkongensis TaxID=1647556 RepID=UPI0008358D7E|nr:MarC family protein [Pseudovibrio hongkongensis]
MPFDFLSNAAAMLFVTIDPIGLAPVFLAVTVGASSSQRRAVALKAVGIAALILLGFFLAGRSLLQFMGISQAAFQVAGGLLLFIIAVEMVFEHRQKRKAESAEKTTDAGEDHANVAVFPLAIPLISGPATISAVILLSGEAPGVSGQFGLLAVIAAVLGLCFIAFLLADKISAYLGPTLQMIITRLFGVLLAALSVQFVADGTRSLIGL